MKGKKPFVVGFLVVLGGLLAAQVFANWRLNREIGEYRENLPEGATLDIGKSRANLFKKGATLTDISFSYEGKGAPRQDFFFAKKVLIYEYDTKNVMPRFSHVRVEKIRLPGISLMADHLPPQSPVQPEALRNLSVNMETRHRFDPDTKRMILEENSIEFPEWGTIKITADIGNYDPELAESLQGRKGAPANPFETLSMLGEIALNRFGIRIEAPRAISRLLEAGAGTAGMDLVSYKHVLVGEMRRQMEAEGMANLDFLSAIEKTILDPGNLEILVVPDPPLQVAEFFLMGNWHPVEVLGRVGLTMRAY